MPSMKKTMFLRSGLFLTAAALFSTPVQAQGLFQKVVGKVAKLSGKMMGTGVLFGTTDNLSENAPGIVYRSNMYPKKLGTMETDLFGKSWVDGGDQVLIYVMKRRGIKMSKLEGGSVTVDGQPAIFQDMGVYTYAVPHSNSSHTVEMKAANGEKTTFTINPLANQMRIVSINGQTGDEVDVDLTKDVTLELSNPGPADGSQIQVSLSASVIGLNTFYDVGSFKPAAKIVIPAAAFANAAMGSSNAKLASLKNAYLQVALVKVDAATATSGQYKNIPVVNNALDWRALNVSGKPSFSTGLKSEGTYKEGEKKMKWAFTKGPAAGSRPFSQATKIGVASFGTRGVSSAESQDNGRLSGIKRESWASFTPSDALLDVLNAELYEGVIAITKELCGGSTIIAPETVAATKAWKETSVMSETDEGTKSSYARAYKTGKMLSDMALAVAFRPVIDGKPMAEEAGVNALLRCVLDLSLSLDKDGFSYLTPTLQYALYGMPASIGFAPTRFAEGTVEGKRFMVSEGTTGADLLKRVSVPDMLAALRSGLMELKEKEKAEPYEQLWNMQ